MLRDPVARIVSHFHYVIRTPYHYLHDLVVNGKISLEEYATGKLSSELNNGQTKQIAGPSTGSNNVLDCAKENLRHHFVAAGLTERFDESLILFRRFLGWSTVFYMPRNVAPGERSGYAISTETTELIAQHNQLDVQLYGFAQQLFEAQFTAAGCTNEEVLRFQIMNRFLAPVWQIIEAGRHLRRAR
jgi:hypothetical protein